MKYKFNILLACIAFVVLFVASCSPQQSSSAIKVTVTPVSNVKTIDLSIESRTLNPNQVTVDQGDEVVLKVRTDESGEFHITGYEIEKEMDLSAATEVKFNANIAGRYNLELHPGAGHESERHHMKKLEADVKLVTTPDNLETNKEATLTFKMKDEDSRPLSNLMIHHGRKVHVLIIGEDLDTLGHIHPEDFELMTQENVDKGEYPVKYTFPRAGRYLIAVDIMSIDGALSKQFLVDVDGEPEMGLQKFNYNREKNFYGVKEEDEGSDIYTKAVIISDVEDISGEYKATFSTSETVKSGEKTTLKYHFEKDGQPVTDFVPYLDAPMHFAIVHTNFDEFEHVSGKNSGFIHAHGGPPGISDQDSHDAKVPDSFGPDLEVTTVFPKEGKYKVYGQVKHDGKIIVSNFMVNVEKGEDKMVMHDAEPEEHDEKEMEMETEEGHHDGSEEDIIIGSLIVNPK